MFVSNHNSAQYRRAFTLIELLVVLSIMVILATLSISGFRNAMDSDRVGEAASTLRATLEGARARAIKAGEARGVRLFLDPADGHVVTSIAYVGAPQTITGFLRVEYDNRDPSSVSAIEQARSLGKWRVFDASEQVDNFNMVNWRDLFNRGLLRPGCDIEIRSNGATAEKFKLMYRSVGTGIGNDDAWVLDQVYPYSKDDSGPPPGKIPTNSDLNEPGAGFGLSSAIASQPIPYTLSLLPAVLEGSSPIDLPANTCIDLDGSRVPTYWRPANPRQTSSPYAPLAPNRAYGPVMDLGTAGLEIRPMDIMFTSKGTADRTLLAEGFLIFRLARIGDIRNARANLSAYLPNTTADTPVVVKDPEYPAKLVTLVTQTGVLHISNVYGEGDNNSTSPPTLNDEIITAANNPFMAAILGREAKQ